MHLLEWKLLNIKQNFTEACSLGSDWQYCNIGSGIGSAPIRRQAIIWTNVGMFHWRIYASLGLNEQTRRTRTWNIITVPADGVAPVIHQQVQFLLQDWRWLSRSPLGNKDFEYIFAEQTTFSSKWPARSREISRHSARHWHHLRVCSRPSQSFLENVSPENTTKFPSLSQRGYSNIYEM